MDIKQNLLSVPLALDRQSSHSSHGVRVIKTQEQTRSDQAQSVEMSLLARLGERSQTKIRQKKGVEDSELPDAIKSQVKRLREIQQDMAEKLAEMQRVLGNKALRADMRKQRLEMLHTEKMTLEANYLMSLRELDQLMRRLQVSPDMQLEALDWL